MKVKDVHNSLKRQMGNIRVVIDDGESIRELDRIEIHQKDTRPIVVFVAAPID